MLAEDMFDNLGSLNGKSMYDQDGEKIGTVGQVYTSEHGGQPEWVTVKSGLLGMKESLVPLTGARRVGDDIHVPYAKETVKEAPRLAMGEHLDPDQERQLYQHYGLTATGTGGIGTAIGTAESGRAAAGAHGSKPAKGKNPHSDELIRSEEQLHITTEEREVGHARLRKVVVTENVTTSVPLSHEEVRVVHEAILPEERAGIRGARIGEAQTEVTLHADQPIISKESVPVERVRLETERVTEQREVSAEVRKEQVEYDTDLDDKGSHGRHGGAGR
ncbi:DUF2382 domain-containing protein [Streptomyces violascens]|uniref:DUF2382 domain-containing protein n=1 Tax=Streptomyces violascens TaxID=67381 RepID=UPI00367BFD92